MSGPGDKYIILFDGVCNLCNGAVLFIIKRDKADKFRFVSLQSQKGQWLLHNLGLPEAGYESFILIKEKKVYQKSTAGFLVLKELGGIWKLFYYLIYIPLPLRDFIYKMIAGYRYKVFGKRNTCKVPSEEIKLKFID